MKLGKIRLSQAEIFGEMDIEALELSEESTGLEG